jgi:RecB family exonuclease
MSEFLAAILVIGCVVGLIRLQRSDWVANLSARREAARKPLRTGGSSADGAFSHTRLEQFEKCPKAYEFKYVKQQPEAFGTIETFMGRTVHSALEWAYQERDSRDGIPSAKDLVKQYERLWSQGSRNEMKVIKKRMNARDYKKTGKEALQSYWKRIFSSDTTQTIALERRFELELDDGSMYCGVIDRMARDGDGQVVLIDYKTGNPRYIKSPRQGRQLRSYAAWAAGELDADEITLCIEDLQGERTLTHPWKARSRTSIVKALKEGIAEVKRAKRFPAQPSVLCGWCGYRPYCKEGKSAWKN